MSARFSLALLLGGIFASGGVSSGQGGARIFAGSTTQVRRQAGGRLSDRFFNVPVTATPVKPANPTAPSNRAKPAQPKITAAPGLRQAIEQATYRVKPSGQGTYRGLNAAQRVTVEFDAGAARIEHAEGSVAFRLLAYGHGEHLSIPLEAKRTVIDNRIEYRRGDLTEWYKNEARGLEQGFTLAHRPGTATKGEPLVIAMAVEGELRPSLAARGDAVLLESGGHTILRYGGLRSWDARGRSAPTRLEVTGREVRLVVDDRDAEYPLVVDPTWIQEAELTASDGAAGDFFGYSVAVSGDTAVVGAPVKPIGSTIRQGAAYVFVRSGGTWTQQQELTPEPSVYGQDFGTSVSVSGDTAVIGDPDQLNDSTLTLGAVYVFVRNGATWTQQQKLTPPGSALVALQFGTTVSVSGDTALVGVPAEGQTPSLTGAVYVFVRSGTMWTLQQKLTTSDPAPNDQFGFSISVSGDTAVVGAPLKNLGQGAAYLFVRSGSTWTQQQKLIASDPAGNLSYGWSVAVSGDTAVVGTPGANGTQGAAYVFVRNGPTWTQQQKLIASDGAPGDLFGWSAALSGDLAVVGTGGQEAAYVFVRSGTTWTEEQKLTASDGVPGDQFGFSVAVSGDRVVVGAYLKQIGLNDSQGAVYIFRRIVSSSPNFALTKSHVGNFTHGQAGAAYRITVSNTGAAATSGTVIVTDTVPAGLTATAIGGAGWMCTQPSGPCTRTDALAGGFSYPVITLTVTVAANAPANVTNTATVTGGGVTGNAAANDATAVTPLIAAVPDFVIAKSHVGNFTQGQIGAAYSITVSNIGGAATAGTVTVTDTAPAGLTPTAIGGTGWNCTQPGGPCTRNDALAAGTSYPTINLTVTVAANAPAAVTNTAAVTGGGVTADADDMAIDPTTINPAMGAVPDFAIAKSHAGNFTQGQVGAAYSITVSNTGGAATAGTVIVTDTIPAGLTATAIGGPGWTCAQPGGPCARNDALAAGLSYPAITVMVTVAGNAPATVTNTATVIGGGVTADADDIATDPTIVVSNAVPDDAFQVRFASNLNIGDSVVNLTNTGTLTLPGGLTTTGNLCVNVYTFDQGEELISCCSCLVTPNGLNSLSVRNDLIGNTLTPGIPDSVVIKLVATMPIGLSPTGTGGTCNPASPNATPAGPGISGSLAPGMRAWGTTLHALPTTPVTYGVTETEFERSILSPAELSKLSLFCGFIQANGSGFGICKACRTGGLGASNK